ncbi:hypothetical protein CROQUDRAFT_97027 [Cronartium quercuum f. sp. fusiforme G11]|uniref:Uncharacterized protein n=1 Tax=Cronartium quercuum f. sp. fusiforme G11 TaxID=708437 RepID=A0A9P6NEV7_9BASI|nr:hypothetical protein CROQUDRAFT_97027 [Cronartium quercuum f. sp. fusiforme G11]
MTFIDRLLWNLEVWKTKNHRSFSRTNLNQDGISTGIGKLTENVCTEKIVLGNLPSPSGWKNLRALDGLREPEMAEFGIRFTSGPPPIPALAQLWTTPRKLSTSSHLLLEPISSHITVPLERVEGLRGYKPTPDLSLVPFGFSRAPNVEGLPNGHCRI